MSLRYIRSHYDVPAEVGRRVSVDGQPGVIAADKQSAYIYVLFDSDKPNNLSPCHPTWRVEYLGMGKVRKMTRSQRRYQRYLESDDCFESFEHFLKWEQGERQQTRGA